MKKLSTKDLNRLDVDAFKSAKKSPVVVVLDNVRSMNNVGSVFRTSDGLAIEKIYLCGITGCPPHREIHKTAIGAQDAVEWQHFEETTEAIKSLKDNGYRILALEQTDNSQLLTGFSFEKEVKYAFVFGNEVMGVEDDVLDLCDQVIEIPQFGTKHSFNISVTVGITLWDYFSKTQS